MISHNFNIIQLTARTNTAIPKFCHCCNDKAITAHIMKIALIRTAARYYIFDKILTVKDKAIKITITGNTINFANIFNILCVLLFSDLFPRC